MLYCGLEGISAAELGVDYDEADRPVDGYGEEYEEEDAREEACLSKGVWLADDACAAVRLCQFRCYTTTEAFSYMMLLAMFMNADLIPLFGRALSSKSSGLKSSVASVTDGASMPVNNGTRAPLPSPCPLI